jgi:hypothetical protein
MTLYLPLLQAIFPLPEKSSFEKFHVKVPQSDANVEEGHETSNLLESSQKR